MSIPLEYLAQVLGMAAVSFAFGVVLKLSDLLQEHGYVWFRHAALATGVVSAGLCVGMLALGDDAIHLLWLAVLISWVLRGRIDGPNHGVMGAALLGFVLVHGPSVGEHPWVFVYFLAVLVPLGVSHDLLQYTPMRAPRAVRWFFEQQHLYWYLMAVGYCALFAMDVTLVVCVYGFVKGYGHLYGAPARERLRRIGIHYEGEDA